MTSSMAAARAGTRQWVALGVLTLAVTLLALDATVLALAVPSLSATLGPTSTQLLWIGDIYSFALAGLLVTMGNLADRIGRKKLLLIGAAAFGTASAVGAFAPTPEVLIAARALLGAAGATIMPSTLAIVRTMFTVPAQRTRAIAVWSAGATAGAAIGPLVGGALLERFWWGSVFLLNVPVMLLLLAFGSVLLPESRSDRPGRLDLASVALSIAAVVGVVFAIKRAFSGEVGALAVAAVITGVLAGWLFVRRQRRLTDPLVDLTLFRRPALRAAVTANAVAIFALSGLLFFFSQYLQLVRGLSPFLAGLVELPVTLGIMSVVLFVGALVGRLGVGRAVGAGLVVAALGLLLLGLAEGLPGYLGIALALALTGLGIGAAMTLSTDAVVASVPRDRAGAASSIAETAYELGVALGIAILGSILSGLYRQHLPPLDGLAPDVRAAVTDSIAGTRLLPPGGEALLAEAREAFTVATQWTSVVAAALLLAAGVFAWRTLPRSVEPDREATP